LLEKFTRGGCESLPGYEATVSAKHVKYWDYDRDVALTCPSCGWTGRGGDHEEYFEALLDVTCPDCDSMLLIVSFPTAEETRAAAAAGDPRAQAELPHLDAREAFLKRARALALKEPGQLPLLEGDALHIDWDYEERDAEHWTVLRHGGQEIWRELAYFEGYERFAKVFEILRERYGSRLAEVRPTPASTVYLYGDKLSAPETIERLNASLARD